MKFIAKLPLIFLVPGFQFGQTVSKCCPFKKSGRCHAVFGTRIYSYSDKLAYFWGKQRHVVWLSCQIKMDSGRHCPHWTWKDGQSNTMQCRQIGAKQSALWRSRFWYESLWLCRSTRVVLFLARRNEFKCYSATKHVSLWCKLTEAGASWKRWVGFSGTLTRSATAPGPQMVCLLPAAYPWSLVSFSGWNNNKQAFLAWMQPGSWL